ncbi:hypothetical protein E2C01_049641 [Portunus trituberculatus]|uniref:Uncharacterized protein n=1 Tax=Portunus trituberculatus TaxID=210409 RepID=A0A5B7GEE9_PORTR|nr:hypothetical protein [Portunus trituberculatus]
MSFTHFTSTIIARDQYLRNTFPQDVTHPPLPPHSLVLPGTSLYVETSISLPFLSPCPALGRTSECPEEARHKHYRGHTRTNNNTSTHAHL